MKPTVLLYLVVACSSSYVAAIELGSNSTLTTTQNTGVAFATRLLTSDEGPGLRDDDNSTDCERPSDKADPCAFVQNTDSCGDAENLLGYLEFRYCSGTGTGWVVLSTLVLLVWLAILISLLATTADVFFIPPLNYLSNMFKLSPAVAGITLLAYGNGAPDVFTALAAVKADEFSLVLGALTGASICISSFVLGSVLIVSKDFRSDPSKAIKKEDFLRDCIVYIVAVSAIVAIAVDGEIHIEEAISLLVMYVSYVGIVVFMSRRQRMRAEGATPLMEASPQSPRRHQSITAENEPDPDALEGLDWPSDAPLREKVQFVAEFVFSILRWLSVPSTNGSWGPRRRILSCTCFLPFACIVMIVGFGLDSFSSKFHGFPVFGIVSIVCGVATIIAFATSNADEPPKYNSLYALIAFVSAVAWLNLLANECVAVLVTLGTMWNVSSSILGLTVLAIGNSVGDFVADTTVARKGSPATAVASCFGSPLLNDVVGLGLALTVTTAKSYPEPFVFTLHRQVPVAWGFLYLTLLSSLIMFPLSQYWPSALYGGYLISIYIAFLITSILVAIFWA